MTWVIFEMVLRCTKQDWTTFLTCGWKERSLDQTEPVSFWQCVYCRRTGDQRCFQSGRCVGWELDLFGHQVSAEGISINMIFNAERESENLSVWKRKIQRRLLWIQPQPKLLSNAPVEVSAETHILSLTHTHTHIRACTPTFESALPAVCIKKPLKW